MNIIHIAVGEGSQNLDKEKNSSGFFESGRSSDLNREWNASGFREEAIE